MRRAVKPGKSTVHKDEPGEQCGKEEANEEIPIFNRKVGVNVEASSVNDPGRIGSGKYGAWMLVSRRDRRDRNRKNNPPREGETTYRRQETRERNVFEGLGTQSRFASLDGLDEPEANQEYEMADTFPQDQPANPLPRIRTREQNRQRNVEQRDEGRNRGPAQPVEDWRAHLPQQGGFQFETHSGFHPAQRGGHQTYHRGGYHQALRGGYNAAPRGNYQRGNRENPQPIHDESQGRRGRGGTPNRAAAESEHTVVRGSNRELFKTFIAVVVIHHARKMLINGL
nr:uncharacterized protein LOC109171840 [Ipomoea trifida]